jgi:predicted nucleic-acid-binding protein
MGMIGLDTNVLVRLLTADEPAQLRVATRLLAEHEGEAGAFFVNDVVLVELVWVLGRLYGFERGEALGAVKSLLDTDAFAFEDRERLERVVDLCRQQARDFADTLIALKNKDAACEFTASFDRAMRGLPGVRVL